MGEDNVKAYDSRTFSFVNAKGETVTRKASSCGIMLPREIEKLAKRAKSKSWFRDLVEQVYSRTH